MSVPRFREYLPTGDPVIPSLPAGWSVALLRNVGQFLKGRGGSKRDASDSGVPCIRYGELYTTFSYSIRAARSFVPTELAGEYQPISRGDVLFAASGEDMADIGRSAVNLLDGPTVCGGDIVILRPTVDVLPEFLGFACDSIIAKAQKAMMGRGTTVKHIYPDELRRVVIAVPPRSQQEGIVSFLDTETAKIDALIAGQERLIALLQEKRQAVISHAVTEGLDPNVPMKDSGVEWIGRSPSHWSISKFLRYVDVAEGQVDPRDSSFDSLPLIAPNHVESGTGRLLRLESAAEQGAESGKYLVKKGDVVYSKIRPSLRKVCLAPVNGLCSADMYPLRPRSGLTAEYLCWWMLSEPFSAFATVFSDRVAMPKVNRESLKEAPLPIPPVGEQALIAEFLAVETTRIDETLDSSRKTISLLRERRTALITAAVTGQIDVRGLVETAA